MSRKGCSETLFNPLDYIKTMFSYDQVVTLLIVEAGGFH